MGSPIQEILRRRGGKERQKYLIKKVLLLAALLIFSILHYFKFPSTKPLVWFIPSGLVFFTILYFSIVSEDKRFYFELMLFPAILLSALSQYFSAPWILYLSFPYLTLLAFHTRVRNTIIVCSLFPLININEIMQRNDISMTFFYPVLFLSILLMVWLINQAEKENEDVKKFSDSFGDESFAATNDPLSLQDESLMSHYFSTLLETDTELRIVLNAVRSSLLADSATFFENNALGQLHLRLTTEEGDKAIMPTYSGMIKSVSLTKKEIIAYDVKAKKTDAGYIKKNTFDSLAAVCVMEGEFVLGVLVVDSDRYKAFKQSDLKTLRDFANIISNIIRRGRIYPQIKLTHEWMKIIQDESLQLMSTLNILELCGKTAHGINRISGEPVVIFLRREHGNIYELVESKEIIVPEEKEYMLDDTILNMCIENKQNIHLSDVSSIKKKILPFKIDNISSVLCLPIISEDEVLGIVVTYSNKKDAFNIYQIEGINILKNQASLAIDNVNLLHKIDEMAITDGLTGLFNHRHFQERLTEEIKRVGRSNASLSLILMDIDFFKKVNDAYGHPAGDAVLKSFAEITRNRTRETDILARYGGEEFALILTNTDSKGAKSFAEDLRKDVLKAEFPIDGRMLRISISLGISTFPDDAATEDELIEKADQALYSAKQKGRNMSVQWSGVRR